MVGGSFCTATAVDAAASGMWVAVCTAAEVGELAALGLAMGLAMARTGGI
jgi:hypothetical protein